MKKRLCFLCLIFVVGASLMFAAGNRGGSGSTSGGTINWLVSSNANQLRLYEAMLQKFTAETGIQHSIIATEYEQLYPRLQTLIASNQNPEITSWGTEFVPWAARGAMTPLDDWIVRDNFDLSRFNQNMVDSMRWDGKLWQIPYSLNTCVMFYNKDLFDKAGLPYPTTDWNDKSWTVDAFIELAKKLTLDRNGRNALDPAFDASNIQQFGIGGMQSWWFAPWYYGGDWTDREVTQFTGNQAAAARGLQFIADLANVHHVMPTPAQSQAIAAGGNVFLTGRVAMIIDGNWSCSQLVDAAFAWDMAATPGGTQHSTVLFTDGFGVGGRSRNPEGGWEFIKWLYSNQENRFLILEAGSSYLTIPSNPSDNDAINGILRQRYPNARLDVLFNAASVAEATPVYMRYHRNFNQFNDIINQKAITPVLAGENNAATALSAIKAEIDALLRD
jgi:multiple sugar transport system substrate-binding protein